MDNNNHKQRIFSGVQPTGNLHLGNYLGAVKNFVKFQSAGNETLYCIVDLHAITVWQNPSELKKSIRELAATFIACGLDSEKSILFNQSQVSSHSELAWVFNCVTRMGWLNRMTQFKDKAGKNRENASVGLFVYPSLMAADILAYHATHVPVGDDQKQHLELTRDIAIKFNNDFNNMNRFKFNNNDIKAFNILGVSVGLKWEKVQEKFKKLVKKFHPDMNAGNKKFEDRLKVITLAYTQLKNTYREKIDTKY